MKVAAVRWQEGELKNIKGNEGLKEKIGEYLKRAVQLNIDLIVFPAFTGCYFEQLQYKCNSLSELKRQIGSGSGNYIREMKILSGEYDLIICPGSCWEREGEDIFHTSYILSGGKVLLKQRQLYLARWEREIGLSRGITVGTAEIEGWKSGIVLATDIFYPRVSRRLALVGVDLIFCPVGFKGRRNEARQIAGVWREVQQNLFFAVEAGFNGRLVDMGLWSESILHAPLEMTEKENGILARSNYSKEFIYSYLDGDKRKKAVKKFNILEQLNPEFYLNNQ